jgi:hypothetical protein
MEKKEGYDLNFGFDLPKFLLILMGPRGAPIVRVKRQVINLKSHHLMLRLRTSRGINSITIT